MAHGHDPNEKIVYVGDSRVRKKTNVNIPADYSAYPGKSEAFIPNFLLKEWMVGAVILVGYMALVIAHPSPLGYPANPNNTLFIPMPDWYFLFLYQLLKYPYVSDQFVVLGTVVIPGLAFGGLMLAPFLDTGKERRWYKRPVASSLMLLSLVAVVYLTHVSWDHYQHELEARGIVPEHIQREMDMEEGKEPPKTGTPKTAVVPIVDEDSEGMKIYQKATCVTCHAKDLKGMQGAIPALRGIGDMYTKEELVDIMKNGIRGMVAGQWDASLEQGLTEEDMNKLAEWLAAQKAPTEG